MASIDDSNDRDAVMGVPIVKPARKRIVDRAKGDNYNGGKDVGVALRVAYQTTVDEAVPAEMLDLLGKLS